MRRMNRYVLFSGEFTRKGWVLDIIGSFRTLNEARDAHRAGELGTVMDIYTREITYL